MGRFTYSSIDYAVVEIQPTLVECVVKNLEIRIVEADID